MNGQPVFPSRLFLSFIHFLGGVSYRWLDHFSEGVLSVVLPPNRRTDAPLVVLLRFERVRDRGQLVLETLHAKGTGLMNIASEQY